MESDRCEVVLEKPYRVPKNLEEDVARAIDECPVTALSKE
jgi:ferredoxin